MEGTEGMKIMEISNHFRLRSSFICLLNKSFRLCIDPKPPKNQSDSLYIIVESMKSVLQKIIMANSMAMKRLSFVRRKSNGNCVELCLWVMFLIKNNLRCPRNSRQNILPTENLWRTTYDSHSEYNALNLMAPIFPFCLLFRRAINFNLLLSSDNFRFPMRY